MITPEHKLKVFLERVENNKKILPSNKKKIKEFLDSRKARGNATNTLLKYLYPLYQMNALGWIKKPFSRLTAKDIEKIVINVEKMDWSPKTKKNFRLTIKVFYRWLEGENNFGPGGYPDRVRFISSGIPKRQRKELSFNEILSREEVIKMVQQSTNPMHKALLWVAFESGGRPEEVLNMNKSDIEFDSYGTKVFLRGSKSKRPSRLVSATEPLRAWLRVHPLSHQSDSPLWVTSFNKKKDNADVWTRLADPGANVMLKKLAEKAGIKNKKVTMYSLRKGRATELAASSDISHASLHMLMGWEIGSPVSKSYIKMSGKDIEESLLRASGIKVGKKEIESFIQCHKCGAKNPPSSLFCERAECGQALIIGDVQKEIKDLLKQMDDKKKALIQDIINHPDLEKVVSKAVAEKKTDREIVETTVKTTGY